MDTLWTIGHSTRPLDVFVAMLRDAGVACVADVRRHPGSRRNPQFGAEALAASLPEAGIDFVPMPELGGRRKALAGSANGAWRNAAFQGYADHLASAEFAEGLGLALELAARRRTVLMCAEAVWWRCHRALISDVLKLRGIQVLHILDATHAPEHPWSAAARVEGGQLGYPPDQPELFGPA